MAHCCPLLTFTNVPFDSHSYFLILYNTWLRFHQFLHLSLSIVVNLIAQSKHFFSSFLQVFGAAVAQEVEQII